MRNRFLFEEGSDSEEEVFVDADKQIEAAEKGEPEVEKKKKKEKKIPESYDPIKREPKFAKAEATCLFELHALAKHTHPTV